MLRGEQVRKISTYLNWFYGDAHARGAQNMHDFALDAEEIFRVVLSVVLDCELKNLNKIQPNYPAVDLGDFQKGIGVQVTVQTTTDKIERTLDKFFDKNKDQDFPNRLLFMIVVTEKRYNKDFKLPRDYPDVKKNPDAKPFSKDNDIWDIARLVKEIEKLADEKIDSIYRYLKQQMGTLPDELVVEDNAMPEHLLPSVPAACDGFLVGSRDRELEILEDAVHTGRPVFIWGLGGMGKSQTAIQLAKRCARARGAYFLRYDISMRETIRTANISGYRLEAHGETDHEVLKEQEYREKLEILRREYKNTILVIDNFNVDGAGLEQLKAEPSCQDVLALENLGVHLIFTTRYDPGMAEWEIGPMAEERLVELMGRNCADVSEVDMRRLIRAVGGHTLMVELIAKTLEESWNEVTPAQVLDALERAQLDQDDFPDVTSDKDGQFRQEQIYHHIQALFNLSDLSEGARRLLSLSTLMAVEGLDDLLFRDALNASDKKELRNLIKRSWLQRTEKVITIHPAICQVVRGELRPTEELVRYFLDKLWDLLQKKEYSSKTLRRVAQCMDAGAACIDDSDVYVDVRKRAMTLWEQILPDDSMEMARIYSDMGGVYLQRGDVDNAMCCKRKAAGIKNTAVTPSDAEMKLSMELLEKVKENLQDLSGDEIESKEFVDELQTFVGVLLQLQKEYAQETSLSPEIQVNAWQRLMVALENILSLNNSSMIDTPLWEWMVDVQKRLREMGDMWDYYFQQGKCIQSYADLASFIEEIEARADSIRDWEMGMISEFREESQNIHLILQEINQTEDTSCNEN